METTVKQRLIEYLKLKGIGQNRFEKMAGLSIGYISKLRIEPSPTKLRGIINAAPDLNQEWLLTGKGEMLVTDVTPMRKSELEEYTETKAGLKFFTREDGQIVMKVPVVPIAALGSPEDEFAELVKEHEGDTVSVVVDSVHHGSYVAFRVDGDSMDDGTRKSFERGDVVVVRELDRDKWLPKLHIRDWPFWVIVFGNCVRIKEIISQDETSITCHSLNPSPEYTDFTLHLDDVSRLFNVIQKIPKAVFFGDR